jgi:hypothetical protein
VSEPFDVHLVSHTHWDREWYHPAPRFRQRLVALVDTLLDGAANASDTADAGFLLDGQAVVLEDYLAVRPERAPELASSLRDGRLEAGPWYVLADELIPSAESLVRNLLAGGRVLRTLGASAPQVLYSPDAFGHPAALPTLAAGFGLPLIIAWRGYGGRRWPEGDAVRWRSAAGDEALLVHLPPDGYEFGSSLPTDDDGASARWQRLRDVLVPRARLGILLVQNGADHHAPQRGLRLAVAALARAAHPDRLHASSLSAFAREASERAARLDQPLPAVEGELRDSYGYTWTLAGTLGSRAAQKRHAAAVERLLLREAEPWAALARLATGGSASFRLHLAAAWKTLLRCHPHDTLCGCSSDEVARAMDARLQSARTQAIGVRDDALLALVRHDPEEARERRSDWRAALLLANAAPRARGGVAEVEVLTFIRDEPVGPGSARLGNGATRSGGEEPPPLVPPGTVMQELSRERRFERTESPRYYPDNDLVDARRYLAWVDTVPGGTVVPVELAERAGAPRNGPPSPARAAGREIANDRLTVRLMGDRVSLAAGGAAELRDVLGFESRADHGDLYTPSLRGERVSRGIQDGSVTSRGPLRAELECRWTLTVPTNPAPPAAGGDAYPDRLAPVIAGRAALIVDAGASFLRIHIRGENTARDHRLRVRLSTGVARPDVWADAAFGPVRRAPLDVPPEDQVAETPPPTAPLHRYVSCYGASSGATVFSDGLAEYEVTEQGDVYVTLVRAVGELSRGDLPERPGHAGWPMATPEAQCLGPFEAKLALMLHGPRSAQTMALVERTADDVLLPLRGTTLRSAYGELTPAGGLELVGDGLTFSTCKESEDGAWTVLRCTNVTEHPVKGAWHLGLPITEARLARLDETPLQELAVNDGVVRFPARARDVVTVLVR